MTRHGSSDLLPPYALSEAHLSVRDLDRSIAFYRDVVGLELAHVMPERQVAFFWIGGPGRSMLGLWSGSAAPNTLRLQGRGGCCTSLPWGSPRTPPRRPTAPRPGARWRSA